MGGTVPLHKRPVKVQPGTDRHALCHPMMEGQRQVGDPGRPGIAFLTSEITPCDPNGWGIPRSLCSHISAVTA